MRVTAQSIRDYRKRNGLSRLRLCLRLGYMDGQRSTGLSTLYRAEVKGIISKALARQVRKLLKLEKRDSKKGGANQY